MSQEEIREARDAARGAGEPTRWQVEFPYHWDADDFISRRELLRFAVMASGALFLGTGAIGALSQLRPLRVTQKMLVARVSQVAPGGVHYFNYPTSEDQAVLLRLTDGRFVAYSQRCTHLSCAVYYDASRQKLICPCHEGAFDPRTGSPVAGPPQRPLPRILLQQQGDQLFAVEEVPS
jgi:nitrite reductase/ring-hydroxylating ferredoxin subunit